MTSARMHTYRDIGRTTETLDALTKKLLTSLHPLGSQLHTRTGSSALVTTVSAAMSPEKLALTA